MVDAPETKVRRNLWRVVSLVVPGAVVSHRTAIEMRPAEDGSVFLTAGHDRRVELPGLRLRMVQGPGAVENQFLDALGASFGLPASDTQPLRLEAAAAQFRAELIAVLADHRISAEERIHLDMIATTMGIPLVDARAAIERTARALLAYGRSRATKGAVVSRAGIAWIRTAAENLGIAIADAENEELKMAEAHWARLDLVLAEQLASDAAERDQVVAERARMAAEVEILSRDGLGPALDVWKADGHVLPCHTRQPARLWGWRPHPTNRFEPGSACLEDEGHIVITANEWCFEGTRVVRRIPLRELTGVVVHPDGLILQREGETAMTLGFDNSERTMLVATVFRHLRRWESVQQESRTLLDIGIAAR